MSPAPSSRVVHRVLPSALAAVVLAACMGGGGEAAEEPVTLQGECAAVHDSDICTWGETVGSDVVAFGATIPIGVVTNAPMDAPMVWPPVVSATLALPAGVQSATGFHLLTVFWEAHGHPPGPYLTPHFDFHFYGIPEAELDAIDCVDLTKPTELAAGYELPDVTIPEIGELIGLCVQEMGMHALPSAEMHSSEMFEKTMVVGYDRARPIFIEPMITAATLNGRQTFTLDVPTVPNWPATGRYPTSFQAEWDEATQSYRFVFSGLTGAGGA